MEKPIVILFKILLFIAFVLYGWGVVNACRFSLDSTPALMSPVIGFIVSSMTSVFATNLGAVLGIGVLYSSAFNYKPWEVLNFKLTAIKQVVSLQIFACYFYLICVAGVIVVWGILGFSQDPLKIVLLLPELTESLIGVVIVALAAWLGVTVLKRNLQN